MLSKKIFLLTLAKKETTKLVRLETEDKPSLSFLIITLASGIVPINVPPGRSKADTFAKARLARASVLQE